MKLAGSGRRALGAALITLGGAVGLVGFDSLTLLDYRRAEARAEAAMLAASPGAEPLAPGRRPEVFNRELLLRAPAQAIVFVGNSIVETGLDPPTLARVLALDPQTEVLVFGLRGTSPLSLFEALAASAWRPALVVVDLPRMRETDDGRLIQFLLTGREPGVDGADLTGPKPHEPDASERWLDATLAEYVPSVSTTLDPGVHLRALWRGLRYGPVAYRSTYVQSVAWLAMDDGSYRIALLDEPRLRAAARRQKIARTRQVMAGGAAHVREDLDDTLTIARLLATEGSRVVLVRMPLSAELRALDDRLNGAAYAEFERSVGGDPAIACLDLGADPDLAAVPFYDGHHRTHPSAIEASPHIARCLAPFLPPGL